MKQYTLYFLLMLSVVLGSCGNTENDVKKAQVKNGLLNIAELGFDEIIALQGEFAFEPNTFVDPLVPIENYTSFENPAVSWTKYAKPLPLYGYGTYAIKMSGFSDSAVYALKLPACSSAVRIFADGNEIYSSGKPSDNRAEEVFLWHSGLAVIPTVVKKDITFVFHISNFHDQKAGFFKPLSIGFYSSMIAENNIDFFKQIAESAVLLVMGAFFTSLFMFYTKERTSLYFGFLAWNFSLRILCYDECLLTFIFSGISGILLHKLGYLTFTLALMFFVLFIDKLFVSVKKRYVYFSLLPMGIYTLIIIFTPTYFFSGLLNYMQVYVVLTGCFYIGVVIRALLNKQKPAAFFLIGCAVFLILVIRDMLISNGIIIGSFASQFGIFTLLIPMAVIVLRQFVFIFRHAAMIAEEITGINEALAKFVPNEFMTFLNKKHTDIKLGDNTLKDMFIVFIHLGIEANLEEKASRQELLTVYNATLAQINPVIEQYSGFIDKYLPEGIMALFYGSADDTLHCIMEINSRVQIFNIERELERQPVIHFAAGVHYGQLMLGTIGEEERMDSTVISDTVNVASRLHAYAVKRQVSVFISETVKNLIKPEFWKLYSYFYHGKIVFKGKEKSVGVYEVSAI